MGSQLVVGAGPVGQATARVLAQQGKDVLLASRSGSGPDVTGVVRVTLDAADLHAVVRAAQGADVVYNCVNPPHYHRWESEWPPIAAALLAAAEKAEAVLATVSSLYPYGPVDGPMVEGQPDAATDTKGRVRARMWAEALRSHEQGRVRAVEVRASDYVGDVPASGGHIPRVVPAALQGKGVRVVGDPAMPHTWTDVHDVARALVAVAGDEGAHGRVWHVPSNPPRSQEQVVHDVCRAAGREPAPVRGIPAWALAGAAAVAPMMREVRAIQHQFTRPFVMDSQAIARELDLHPTPWPEVCARTAAAAVTEPARSSR